MQLSFLAVSPHNKELGAYYTPPEVVGSLVEWATSGHPGLRVLDPSCGDGRFLDDQESGVGVDLDPAAIVAAKSRSVRADFVCDDFFVWAPSAERNFDAVVGNPPFIRYQRFTGATRERALEFCRNHGVSLSALASSWAMFVVGASVMLRRGGRLALVVPAEIGHASYARPVIQFLLDSFGSVTLDAIRSKLFPELSEDCWLLRAADFGGRSDGISLRLFGAFDAGEQVEVTREVSRSDLALFDFRVRPFLMSAQSREAYAELSSPDLAYRLGELAKVGIGYVTGANDFFHVRPSDVSRLNLPEQVLRPAVRTNRDLGQGDVSPTDLEEWRRSDKPYLLVDLSRVASVPPSVERYLDSDAGRVAREAYKCRMRDPWYRVPDVVSPGAFLQLMSSGGPRLVSNSARCVCTNSVHAVQPRPGVDIEMIKRKWNQPIVSLSCEIEGRPLGGGMLKMEPADARRIVVPRNGDGMHTFAAAIADGIETMRAWRHTAHG